MVREKSALLAVKGKEHIKTKVLVVNDKDREAWELVVKVPKL